MRLRGNRTTHRGIAERLRDAAAPEDRTAQGLATEQTYAELLDTAQRDGSADQGAEDQSTAEQSGTFQGGPEELMMFLVSAITGLSGHMKELTESAHCMAKEVRCMQGEHRCIQADTRELIERYDRLARVVDCLCARVDKTHPASGGG